MNKKTYLSTLFNVKFKMCGILYVTGNAFGELRPYMETLIPRGPDAADSVEVDNVFMGFTRLRINDLSDNGMQPMWSPDGTVVLICNGEIFNQKELIQKYGFTPKSSSDCEVILHLYMKYRNTKLITNMLDEIDGEFAFVIYDSTSKTTIATRDRFGVRPLFRGKTSNVVAYASEMKALSFCDEVAQLIPGTYDIVGRASDRCAEVTNHTYHSLFHNKYVTLVDSEESILNNINSLFRKAVEKRLMSERPICCLLSGGLDSSLVSSLVASHFAPNTVHTFSIGFEGSPDLYYAKKVAEHIKSLHHEVIVKEPDFLDHIEDTIRTIESYDTTSVRASVGNLLISKYISDNTDFKVVFNGDYSDEVCGGYKYFKNAPSSVAFDDECRRLVSEICYFDSLRSDRTISSQGLEARVPFSDHAFVNYYFSIPIELRMQPDKYLLRKAFERDNLLPAEILWRPKEAFSDGVSKKDNSWHMILKKHIDSLVTDHEFEQERDNIDFNKPLLKESYYYRKIYNKHYGKYPYTIPYFWMPKWCDSNLIDPSAREIV